MSHAIKTVQQFDQLPVGAAVLAGGGTIWQRVTRGEFHDWRSTRGYATSPEGILDSRKDDVRLIYSPEERGPEDARKQAMFVAEEILAAELGLSHDTDDIAKRVVDALAGDGLIHHSPIHWHFTPGCSLTVHGPGIIPVEDLAAAPPGSMLITEVEKAWMKYQGDIWMLQMDQQYIRMFIQRYGLHPQPKSSYDLSNAGPAVLITTHWEE